jgi:hypothetical protein
MKKVKFFVFVILLIIMSCAQEKESTIEGIWQMSEYSFSSPDSSWINKSPQPSLFIFIKDYYSYMYVSDNEPRPLMPEGATRSTLTDEQFRKIFLGIIANSGKYDLVGNKLTIRPIVALEPNLMGGAYIEHEYKMDGDTMWLTRAVTNGNRLLKLIRLEY